MTIRLGLLLVALSMTASLAQASPIDIPGLLYHLDAATANITQSGGLVSSWNDSSGNGNNFAQGDGAKQPTYNPSSAFFNNLPVVHFNGDLTGAGSTAPNASRLVLSNPTAPETVFIVERTTVANNLGGIWGINEADTGIRMKDANNWQVPANGGNTNDFPTSTTIINGVVTANQPLGSPAVLVAYGNVGTFGATGLGEYFDCCGAGARPWGGDIAEVAVYSGTLDGGQTAAIESYLQDKYFPTPEPTSFILAALGAVGLFVVARRRRNG